MTKSKNILIRWNYDLIKNYVETLGYILINDRYSINGYTKLILMDDDGYYYLTTIIALRNSSPYRFHKTNPFTIYNINLWCEINQTSFKLISVEYKNATDYLRWKCFICKDEFNMGWDSVHAGHGCGVCKGFQVGKSNCLATKHPDLARQWHPILNKDLTPYDITFGSDVEIWWLCSNNSKHIWKTAVSQRFYSNSDCPYCSGRNATEENNLLVLYPKLCEEWDYSKNEKKPEYYLPYSSQMVYWKCLEHGHSWKAIIASRTNGNGCFQCNTVSNGEKRIVKILEDNNILFKPQKRFKGLLGLGNGSLSYDFYLPEYNLLIEMQGIQHEKYTKRFHKSQADFEKQLEHDKRKRLYAFENNIELLEIWYYDYKNIEQILMNELNIKE